MITRLLVGSYIQKKESEMKDLEIFWQVDIHLQIKAWYPIIWEGLRDQTPRRPRDGM